MIFSRTLLCLCSVLVAVNNVENSKILGIFPVPSYSHYTTGFKLLKELADRGHEVTMINPFPQKTPIANYRDVVVVNELEAEDARRMFLQLTKKSPLESLSFIFDMCNNLTETTFSSPEVQNLLHSNETFDVVITEEFLMPSLLGVAHHLNAPNILLSSRPVDVWNSHYFGNPDQPAYVPHKMSGFVGYMNVFQRLKNLSMYVVEYVMREFYLFPKQNEILHKYLPNAPHVKDIVYNQSLILLNGHFSYEEPVPVLPNMVDIGGFHVTPPKALPKDLQSFLNGAKDGVIYFSLGSNLLSAHMAPEKLKAILGAFAKLKQKVLWKFEDNSLRNIPPNVRIEKWFPQSDVLAHPNVRAFISHGGVLGIIEAVYHGVPLIGMPIYGDQQFNVARAVHKGYALMIDYHQLTEEKLSRALSEILSNPKYWENIQRRSKLLRDRPVKPIDLAVYWVEYVIRHGGTPCLRSAELDLRWYQRSLLDLVLILTAISALLFYVFYKIIKWILKPRPRNSSKLDGNAKKNH